ncbi:hypothetical protein BU067_04085 [Staphylococcus succinus]|nr:hypothetical protein BU067_04085 [Staphylococcus succinus]RIN41899.1 hypothetical protein BU059_08905 [Staphylococcus succinus]
MSLERKSDFKNWVILIINIIIVLAFIFLIWTMFEKHIDFVYIICTLLITLLPLSNVYIHIKKINKK